MTRIHLLFLSFFIFVLTDLHAIVAPDTINIAELVVTGNRIEVNKLNSPVTITVISSELIKSQEESNILPVVTRFTPGMFISEIGTSGYALGNGTSGQLTIRGVGGSPNAQVLMLVDGQPQFMGVFGHPLPNFHMASNIERVEVVRGPSSLLYGSNAMGGVINMISKRRQNEGFGANATVSYGSFNTLQSGASLSYSNNKVFAGVNFNHNQTEGHRDSSAFNISSIHAFAGAELNKHWTARAGFTWAAYSFQDPGSEYAAIPSVFSGDIKRTMATLSISNNYSKIGGGLFGFYNTGNHVFSDGWVSDDINIGINIYQAASLWTGGTITGGIDMKSYGGKGSKGFLADSFITVSETAGYLVADQKIGEFVNLNAGARYEKHSVFGGELVPQAGLTVKLKPGMAVKGLLSKGFRSPTIMELYLFAPNAELGPERLWNYEIAWDQAIADFGKVELTAYMINGTDLILVQPNPNPGPPMIRSNGGEFNNWGFEVESSFYPLQGLRIDANYSFLNTDTKIYFAPAHQFYLGAMYSTGDFRLALNMKTISGLYTNIDSENPGNDTRESYAILNAKASYKPVDFLEVFLAGKNLLNQSYETVYGYPMPGINFMLGVSLQID